MGRARVSTFSVSLEHGLKKEVETFANRNRLQVASVVSDALKEFLEKRQEDADQMPAPEDCVGGKDRKSVV